MKANFLRMYLLNFQQVRNSLPKTLFLLFLLSFSISVYSQSMCPIEFLKVNKVSGKIEFNDKNSEPFQKVKVELRKDDDEQGLVSESLTNENGLFEFIDIKRGKYILIANFESDEKPFFDYRAAVKVKETNSLKNKPSILIRFDVDCFKTKISTIK